MVAAGDVIAASDWNNLAASVRPLSCRRTSDLARPSTTSPTADSQLLIASIPASSYYHLSAMIAYSADSAADMKGGMYGPANATLVSQYQAAPSSVASSPSTLSLDATGLGNGFAFGGTGAANIIYASFDGVFYSGDGGTMGFTWAQVASSATATTVRTGSYIKLTPIS